MSETTADEIVALENRRCAAIAGADFEALSLIHI